MIARVKIAPIEQWCSEPKEIAAEMGAPEVGFEVEILINRTRKSPCGEREWELTKKSHVALLALIGLNYDDGRHGTWICRHLLEMD